MQRPLLYPPDRSLSDSVHRVRRKRERRAGVDLAEDVAVVSRRGLRSDDGTELIWEGELGTDLGALGG